MPDAVVPSGYSPPRAASGAAEKELPVAEGPLPGSQQSPQSRRSTTAHRHFSRPEAPGDPPPQRSPHQADLLATPPGQHAYWPLRTHRHPVTGVSRSRSQTASAEHLQGLCEMPTPLRENYCSAHGPTTTLPSDSSASVLQHRSGLRRSLHSPEGLHSQADLHSQLCLSLRLPNDKGSAPGASPRSDNRSLPGRSPMLHRQTRQTHNHPHGQRDELRRCPQRSGRSLQGHGPAATGRGPISVLADQRIEWSHTPARSPHFGGIWEAGVKQMKALLYKTLGTYKLITEQFLSILAEAEAILNSRPLMPMDSAPTDGVQILTPAHFLIGRSLRTLPTKLDTTANISLLKHWRLCQRLTRNLWEEWSGSYLQYLQRLHRWQHPKRSLQVGDVVLLKDPELFLCSWLLAVVEQVHPGPDGLVRVATLRTSKGSYKRAVTRIVPLISDASSAGPPPPEDVQDPVPPTDESN